MAQPRIEPQFPGPIANTLIIMPIYMYILKIIRCIAVKHCCRNCRPTSFLNNNDGKCYQSTKFIFIFLYYFYYPHFFFFIVHFRIRVMDQHRPRTLSPSTSGNTYWQIEAESGILIGKQSIFPTFLFFIFFHEAKVHISFSLFSAIHFISSKNYNCDYKKQKIDFIQTIFGERIISKNMAHTWHEKKRTSFFYPG